MVRELERNSGKKIIQGIVILDSPYYYMCAKGKHLPVVNNLIWVSLRCEKGRKVDWDTYDTYTVFYWMSQGSLG